MSNLSSKPHILNITFNPVNNDRLANLCGPCNANLQQLERHFEVKIVQNSNHFKIIGTQEKLAATKQALHQLYQQTLQQPNLTPNHVFEIISQAGVPMVNEITAKIIQTRHKRIEARNSHQHQYLHNILTHTLSFAVGPAGTGKTYLAVACAVAAFEAGKVQRLVFVRPAVEAGEKLGFLPGDLIEKVLPYLRPIYDALYELLGFEDAQKLIANNIIEILPLAFMRGRTLNDAFIILDEAQNTTIPQMKMFLTRIGFGSIAVVTGDITQTDLPKGEISGLHHAISIVNDISDISFNYFTAQDVVRNPIVSKIILAYEKEHRRDTSDE